MFRYINTTKLVAYYLREFSLKLNGEPSTLYKFVFCLCLPFVSITFRRARLISLALAECTNSQDQIFRLVEKITGATLAFSLTPDDHLIAYDGTGDVADFAYDGTSDAPILPYGIGANRGVVVVTLNGASRSTVQNYLDLLIPFYVNIKIEYS